jgi:hypothetical protein
MSTKDDRKDGALRVKLPILSKCADDAEGTAGIHGTTAMQTDKR